MTNIQSHFPHRPDLVKLGTALRRFSMATGVSGSITAQFESNNIVGWVSVGFLLIGAIGEFLTFLYSDTTV